MAATKYIGYIGGVAVAAGVGAAIAVAGQGTAHADSTDGAAKESTSAPNGKAGPKRGEAKRTKPLSKVSSSKATDTAKDHLEKSAAQVATTVKTAKPVAVKPKPKPSAEEFEADQVAKLKDLFTPKRAAAPQPVAETAATPERKTVTAPTAKAAVQTEVDTTADEPAWDPNPFRADDPDPTDFPDSIMNLRQALLNLSPDELDPFVREATEQIYRGSQIVPWVNAVIPVGKIIEDLASVTGNDDEALRARQTIINELIKTTPPGSLAYYGYDIVADLLNMETPAAELKDQAVATVWDFLDPFQLAHVTGESGIGNAAG